LAWAASLTWTLLLNLYVPIWDAVLVLMALLLTLGALKELQWRRETGWIVLLGLAMVLATWNMSATTNRHASQIMTVLLLVLGGLQLALLRRALTGPRRELSQQAALV